jgi:hypothetical protein
MHNRNFVINMVIGGEKTPAFSARSLELPPPQIDNTGRIIENTRRLYSRPRAEIEAEISAAIQPPEHLQKAPASQAQAKQWPVDAGAQPAVASNPTNTSVEQGTDPSAPAKRKRTRTRRKKTSDTDSSQSTNTSQAASNDLSAGDSLHIDR